MKIEIQILEILAARSPDLVREIPLRNEVELNTGEEIALADMKVKLRAMERNGDVTFVSNQDTGTKWTISDQGKARLAKAKE
jgi:hypothetical protein